MIYPLLVKHSSIKIVWLVVEPYLSEKSWSESQLGLFTTEWKVIKFHGSSHHQPEIVDLRIETSDFPGGYGYTDSPT